MNAWEINYDLLGDSPLKESQGISKEEIEKARKENLKDYYNEIHICNICKKQYGSDLKERLHLCPICEQKLKGNKKKKEKLLLKSEKKHLLREDNTK
ncbi:MAG: hypothetical protein ACP5D2_04180 [Candidatus Nanoarchaeia archaeon]